MIIKNCPHCKSNDFEECEARGEDYVQYFCNTCREYFDIFDFMP